jgi:hypothetical protein
MSPPIRYSPPSKNTTRQSKHGKQSMGDTHEADKISNQLLAVERDAWLAWLTTPPTTLAGVIATLEHASRRPYPQNPDYPHDHICTNLAEFGQSA